MFKSLRDKLKGVSSKLEDELETQLADQLEAELAAEMEKDAESAAPSATPDPTPAPEPAPPSPAMEPATAPEPTPDTSTESKETWTPKPPASAESIAPKPEAQEPPTSEAGEPAKPAPETPAPSTPPAPSTSATPSTPPAASTSATPSTPPASSTSPAPTTSSTPSTPPASSTSPAPSTSATPAPTPEKPQPKQQPKHGRKLFSEEEIEQRLQRELDAAVEIQKDVETVASTGGQSAATKFTINEDVLEEILWELELALLESDVAMPVIEAIKESVKEQLLSLPVGRGRPEEIVEKVLRTAIKRVLSVNPIDFDSWLEAKIEEKHEQKAPVVLMFVGVNGTGKTTSIGRIAYRLQQRGISCVMAAGDTFRAGAIEQLALHGDRLGIKVVKHTAGADPAAVAYDAIEHAKARNKSVVLLDTAGRMQNNTNLMDEMDKIRRVANPDLCIFVGDSLAGNDAVEQARKFDEVVDIGGAILTKVDVDAKGGAALSVAYTINKPLLFVGVGQEYPDLRPFDAGWMVERLFGDESSDPLRPTAAPGTPSAES